MKIEITYGTDYTDPKCKAVTTFNGEYVVAFSDTHEKAKARLLGKIRDRINNPVPEPETVEI